MATTAIQTRAGIDVARVKQYLREQESVYDFHLEGFLAEALEVADTYCNNPFLDEEEVERAIPQRVKNGVYEWVAMRFDQLKVREEADLHLNETGDGKDTVVPLREGQVIRSITRDLTDGTKETTTFQSPSQSRFSGPRAKTERQIKKEYWAPYRMTPGF